MKIWKLTLKDYYYSELIKRYGHGSKETDVGGKYEGASTFGEWTSPYKYIIVAETENDARELACNTGEAWDDNRGQLWWKDTELTNCEEIKIDEIIKRAIIVEDYP